jgi:predicted TIM-barrel fold metal-dependent hydrolase
MEALSACPNVWCKISGLTVAGKPWTLQVNGAVIRETIGMSGVDRCMFASNFPVDSVKASWHWIYSQFNYVTAGLPDEDRRKLSRRTRGRFTVLKRVGLRLSKPALSGDTGGNACA